MRSSIHRDSSRSCSAALSATLAMAMLSGAASTGLAQPFVKDGQKRTLATWAAKGLMQSPVSICLDPHGNLYVAESDRAGKAVADTRGLGHLNAVEEDLQFKSVEDRRNQIHRWIKQGSFPPDFFTQTEDRVRIVRDSNGDGVADTSGVFAGGFNGELDGIGAGVLWLNNHLYYTCIPDLYMLTPGKDPYVAEKRESLAHGYGVRWCFYGHDLHGLTAGPDGRIYFSMGDRGFNITTREGVNLYGPDRGGVFRCWPDGSGLELFYQGLRNPQELAFTENGELFTGDNNCDSGDSARVVHVIEGGDSGWRQDVQSLESRGPWNREAMWKRLVDVSGPARPAWSLPPIEHMCAGPSGILLYPGTGESSKYNGCLFLVDFYGSGSTVHALRPVADGAGYKVADHVEYYRGATITDIAWGYDGKLYMSDWGGGWEPNPNGVILTVTNDTIAADAAEAAAVREVHQLFEEGFASRDVTALMGLLGHRDQRVRLAAQYELASRGVGASETGGNLGIRVFDGLSTIAKDASQGAFKRYHAIWAIGQIARKLPEAAPRLAELLSDPDAEIRTQAIKTLGDLRMQVPQAWLEQLTALLEDSSPRVVAYAALALGKAKHHDAIDPLLSVLDRTPESDPALRHACSYALSLIGDPETIITRASALHAGARLGAVVALRRMNDPGVTRFLADTDAAVAIEAARAIYDNRVDAGLADLAQTLQRPIPADRAIEPYLRRAIEANVLVGGDECADRLAAFAARTEIPSSWRLLALQRVAGWASPLKREGVWGNWANYPARSADAMATALRAHISAIVAASQGDEALASLAQQLKAQYSQELTVDTMAQEARDAALPESYRGTLLSRIAQSDPPRAAQVAADILAAKPKGDLRQRAEEVLVRTDPAQAIPYLAGAAATGEVRDRQRAVRLLAGIRSPESRKAMADIAERLVTGMLTPALALDVYESAMTDEPDSPARKRVEPMGREGLRPPGFATALLSAGGDPARGREIFLHHTSAECVRCHTVRGTGGTAGPELTQVASRLTTDKLVESVVEPAATVAAGYGSVTAMPQMTQILTPREVRDVVSFLGTLTGQKPQPAQGHGAAAQGAETPAEHPATHDASAAAAPPPPPRSPSIAARLAAILLLPLTVIVTWRAVRRGKA